VFGYYGLELTPSELITAVRSNPDGGTLAVSLGRTALEYGFRAQLLPFGMRVFDPTWRNLGREALIAKLELRRQAVGSRRELRALIEYGRFIRRGGSVKFAELNRDLIVDCLRAGRPVLTGLSATYLYRAARESNDQDDDVGGEPVGHFVVISGYSPKTDRFVVRDPAREIPFSRSGKYSVPADRLIAAILLGDVTYDANLLVLSPRRGLPRRP
jgi:hypothetical protein